MSYVVVAIRGAERVELSRHDTPEEAEGAAQAARDRGEQSVHVEQSKRKGAQHD